MGFFENLRLRKYKKLAKSIIKSEDLKKISSKEQLVDSIYEYYKNKNVEREKILVQHEIDEIKESNFAPKYSIIITLAVTIIISLLNNYNLLLNDDRSQLNTRINNLSTKNIEYSEKILEIDNKIKYTKDPIEKNRLEDFERSILSNIKDIKQDINKCNDDKSSMNGVEISSICLKLLKYCFLFLWASVFIDLIFNTTNHPRKQYLRIKLNTINLIIKENEEYKKRKWN